MMRKHTIGWLVAGALLAAPAAGLAQAHKCTDASGKSFYSDRPCKSQGMAEQGMVKAPPPRPTDPPPHATVNKPAPPANKAARPAGAGQSDDGMRRDKRGNPET